MLVKWYYSAETIDSNKQGRVREGGRRNIGDTFQLCAFLTSTSMPTFVTGTVPTAPTVVFPPALI